MGLTVPALLVSCRGVSSDERRIGARCHTSDCCCTECTCGNPTWQRERRRRCYWPAQTWSCRLYATTDGEHDRWCTPTLSQARVGIKMPSGNHHTLTGDREVFYICTMTRDSRLWSRPRLGLPATGRYTVVYNGWRHDAGRSRGKVCCIGYCRLTDSVSS